MTSDDLFASRASVLAQVLRATEKVLQCLRSAQRQQAKEEVATAEWNFFATSHGKTACDGIEGTAKRLTLKASLQRPVSNQIITPRDMFSFCSENISGIQFYFVSTPKKQSWK